MHNKGQIESITFGKSKYQDRLKYAVHKKLLNNKMINLI